ncbi:hypothetical protein KXQ82_00365 [Mucilaginibacter sp. HMF5004]|uniref:hypothetical protein n=1 Tax=Mucilaginibacter rivuli TaxID=2857527 RepID=UPI001C5CD02B|nr:hypothetical protein [Mucilaginibacter rivuli]MBW4888139.1 hypothetical protein [Mucilaginibacter rivuli]
MGRRKQYMGSLMRKAALILLLCFEFCLVFGQSHYPLNRRPTNAEDKLAEQNNNCLHRNKYTASQRLRFYPFNKAVYVKLVSFEDYSAGPPSKIHIDGNTSKRVNTDSIYESKIPFRNKYINYSVFKEIKVIDKFSLNKLTDILYNIGDKAPNWIGDSGYSCYSPRNAILFIDDKGNTFAHIDICFECHQYRVSSEKIKMGEFCEQKFDIIKGFFKSTGIEYGVTRIK